MLLVRLHLAGFFWGDVSLSNVLFRRSAGEFTAYLVDAETGELHDALSDGQRANDIEVASTNIFGELLDLQAGDLLGDDVDAFAIVELLQERYDALWAELTSTEEFTTQEMWRIEQRIERLNELGFDVDELDLVTDWDGASVRMQPKVVEAGHHRRELQSLTGLNVEENQARRLLNDLAAFTASAELGGEDRSVVAHKWLTQFYEPVVAMIPHGPPRPARARRGLPRDPRAPVVPLGAGRPRGRPVRECSRLLRLAAGAPPRRGDHRTRRRPEASGRRRARARSA